jgi:hypothetical protein
MVTVMAQVHTTARPRVERLSKAVLLALAVAVVLAVVSGAGLGESTTDGARLGGDYPAFHGAGSIVADGDIDDLYDPARQTAAQAGLGLDGYLAFAYPPHVAMAYAPLSMLGFQLGYLVHTVLMSAALLGALALLRRPVPFIADHFWPIAAVAFTFHPLFTAIGGGQNTAVTVLLMAAIWRGLHDSSETLAGVAAGFLLFRPQYAVPMIGLLFLGRHLRAVGVAAGVGALTWLLVAPFLGAGWISTWVEQVVPFAERDAEVNAANSISLLGVAQALLGADATSARLLGGLGALAVIGAVSAVWLRADLVPLAARMGLASVAVLLMSPHTMFYDAGLLVIAGASLLAGTTVDRSVALRFAAVVWLGAFSHLFADRLGATPLALVVVAAFLTLIPGSLVESTPKKKVVLHA